MFDLQDFLSGNGSATVTQRCPSFPDDLQHCLITGPGRCGKTSILLHYAYIVARRGSSVLFICQRAKIDQVPPLLPPGVDGQDRAFSRVHMRYLSTAADLRKVAASLHLLEELPEAIVVDDFSDFLDARDYAGDKRQRDAELVKTLSFLHEATAYASEKLGTSPQTSGSAKRRCHLLIADPATDGPSSLHLMQRWLPLILMVRGTGPDYTLSVLPEAVKANRLPLACAAQLCYHLAPYSSITLTDIKPPVLEADAPAVLM